MPPKNKFSKEQIINAAFEVAKNEGMGSITIRKIANKLGSSIAPIYVNFKDIEELKKEVMKKIYRINQSILNNQGPNIKFLNIGLASIQFATEYNILFRDLMFNSSEHMTNYEDEFGKSLLDIAKADHELNSFDEHQLKRLVLKMRAFITGLSVLASNSAFSSELSDNDIEKLIIETGHEIINSMKN